MDSFNSYVKCCIESGEISGLLCKIRIDINEYVGMEQANQVMEEMESMLNSCQLTSEQKFKAFIQKYELSELVFTLRNFS